MNEPMLPKQHPPTSPLPSHLAARSSKKVPTPDQAQCGLLTKLPAEVRLIIWKLVIGGMRIRILVRGEKLWNLAYEDERRDYYPCSFLEGNLFSLLRTCQQV
jgi:hypothetical protein